MKDQSGQTIIEAVVAIAVISLAMLGFLSQATGNFVLGRSSENHLIAYNLASEAIEVARNVRDSNWLKGCVDPADPLNCVLWNSGLSVGEDYSAIADFDGETGSWEFDFVPDVLAGCGDKCLLKLSEGVYSVSAGEKTKFSRMIFLQPVCKNKIDCGGDGVCVDGEKCVSEQIGVKITATVGWAETSGGKTYSATEYLYNWR